MNFESERNKPIFVTRGSTITHFGGSQFLSEALANSTVIRAKQADDFLIKIGGAKKLPRDMLLKVSESTRDELKELVSNRLEIDRSEKFRFLDGREFTGAQAAAEVRNETAIGNYFLEMEKETLRIVQEAFLSDEFR